MIVLLILVAVLIYVIGLLANKMSSTNIFTVFAILCVLPWAKQVVALVVFFPFHSVEKERYEAMKKAVEQMNQEEHVFYTDLVITSTEKIMNLDFLLIGAGCVIVRIGKKGQNVGYIADYLKKGAGSQGDYVVVMTEEDEDFEKALRELDPTGKNEDFKKVDEYICSLMV